LEDLTCLASGTKAVAFDLSSMLAHMGTASEGFMSIR